MNNYIDDGGVKGLRDLYAPDENGYTYSVQDFINDRLRNHINQERINNQGLKPLPQRINQKQYDTLSLNPNIQEIPNARLGQPIIEEIPNIPPNKQIDRRLAFNPGFEDIRARIFRETQDQQKQRLNQKVIDYMKFKMQNPNFLFNDYIDNEIRDINRYKKDRLIT